MMFIIKADEKILLSNLFYIFIRSILIYLIAFAWEQDFYLKRQFCLYDTKILLLAFCHLEEF